MTLILRIDSECRFSFSMADFSSKWRMRAGSWITVQTVISTLIEIEGYDWPHEEATVQAGRAAGQCERGGAAPGPGTSAGGHCRTDRLSSRHPPLPTFFSPPPRRRSSL